MVLSPEVWNWVTSLVIIGQTASVRLIVSNCWVVPQRCPLLGLISRTGGVLMGVLALVASRVSCSYVLDLCLALDHQLPASSLDYCWWCWHFVNGFPIDGRKLRLNGVKVYFLPRWEIHWQVLPSLPSVWGCCNCWSWVGLVQNLSGVRLGSRAEGES